MFSLLCFDMLETNIFFHSFIHRLILTRNNVNQYKYMMVHSISTPNSGYRFVHSHVYNSLACFYLTLLHCDYRNELFFLLCSSPFKRVGVNKCSVTVF